MASETAIRLFIVEDSRNDAEAYTRAIVSTGQAVRAHTYAKGEDLAGILSSHQPDLILFSAKNGLLNLAALKEKLAELNHFNSIIILCEAESDISIVDCLKHGARDRVIKKDIEHLKLVVKREFGYVKALTQNRNLRQAYKETEVRYRNLLDNSRDAIAYVHEGMHVYANQAYLETFGFDRFEDIEGLPILDMIASEQQSNFKNFFRGLNGGSDNKQQNLETQLKHTEGSTFKGKMEFNTASIDGEPCIEIIIRKQIDSKQLEEQINKLSKLDSLTGLLNRPSFIEAFKEKLSLVKTGKSLVLYEIGIDKFKDIQEQVGLIGSDQVIAGMAQLIQKHLDDSYIAGRNESSRYFVLAIYSSEKDIKNFAQKIIKTADKHICDVEGKSIHIHCSIGASLVDDETLDVNEAMARTGRAFQNASNIGSCVEIYQPQEGEMTQKQQDAAWVKLIKNALDNNRFKLLYQPIVHLESSGIERYEVFMEMLDEKGERVAPGKFLPAAERTQMSKVIDRWVISNALKQMVKRLKVVSNTLFFIKLTGGSLEDTQLFRWISERIKEHDLPKGRLIFEVKEEAVISHLRQAQAFATLLKTVHCGFAIDDFGTGPEPFKLLEHVPAQFLKFDKLFTQDLAKNEQNQESLKYISDKAKELKKQTIVQHIEDAATLSVLWSIGATFVQGNFFQGPSESMNYDFSSGVG